MYVIYGRPGCRWCVSATRLAFEAGLSFEYIDISENNLGKHFVLSEGHTTVPQIYYTPDGETLRYIGGFEDFKAEIHGTHPKST